MRNSSMRIPASMATTLMLLILAGSPGQAALLVDTVTGTYNNLGLGGTDPGYMWTPASATSIYYGNFGSIFTGPATVSSFSITQVVDSNRHRLRTLEFIGGTGGPVTNVLADSQALQTIAFSTPIQATKGWLAVRVLDTYTSGSTDANFGLISHSFDGALTGTDVDVNKSATAITIVGGLGGGYTRPSHLTNSLVLTADAVDSNGSYFTRDAGVDSIRMDYAGAKDIGLIGLGFEAGSLGNERTAPMWVNVIGSNGQTQQVTLAGNLQFARYPVTGFTGVTWLKLEFPDGTTTNDWYGRTDPAYGVSAFEAIELLLVPEPSTVLLLAAGGGMLAWRRRMRNGR